MSVINFENDMFEGLVPPTEKLYDKDAYLCSFDARVYKCTASKNPKTGNSCFAIVLDRTAFFPEAGGQSSDRGIIFPKSLDKGFDYHDTQDLDRHLFSDEEGVTPARINMVSINEDDGLITHYSDTPFDVGQLITGEIDMKYRFSNMQQHTGEHIFSGLVNSHFGFSNVGFSLTDENVTMDYDGELSDDDLLIIEKEANKAIWENRTVRAFYPSVDELMMIEYRSKKELKGPVRIVEIEGYDICACCAPHVKNTGEIGLLKVLAKEYTKGNTRVYIVCGERAMRWLSVMHDEIHDISKLLSVKRYDAAEAVKKLAGDLKAKDFENISLQRKLLSLEIKNTPAKDGNVLIHSDATDDISIREAINSNIESISGYMMILFSPSEENGKTKHRFIVASKEKDCAALAKEFREKLSAKGGGSKVMAEGTICAKDEEIMGLMG